MQYGLIGEKLGHSFSREIHESLGLYSYELAEVARDQLDAFMQARDFAGINVTIPYKEAVIPFLDAMSDRAREVGAVNTIVNRDGRLFGDNTDVGGLQALIRRMGLELRGKTVLIAGTGGTSKTAHAVARSLGAARVVKLSRSSQASGDGQPGNGGMLDGQASGSGQTDGGQTDDSGQPGGGQTDGGQTGGHAGDDRAGNGASSCGVLSYEQAYEQLSDAQVLINTTPAGMYPNVEGIPVDLSRLPGLEGVVDVVYNPLITRLVREARERGLKAENGLYMLVVQALLAAEAFVGEPFSESRADKLYESMTQGR